MGGAQNAEARYTAVHQKVSGVPPVEATRVAGAGDHMGAWTQARSREEGRKKGPSDQMLFPKMPRPPSTLRWGPLALPPPFTFPHSPG